MNDVIITPEMQELEAHAIGIYDNSKKVTIENQKEYKTQAIGLKHIKKDYKTVESKRKELVKPFQDGVKKLNDFFRIPLTQLKDAESNIKRAILGYDEKLEEERRKEQKKLDDLAEKERRRLQKLAERQEAKGNVEKADETRERAESVPVAVVATPKPQVKGISKRDNWIFIITNPTLIPREYMIPDEKKLGNVARATKGTLKIPGVVIKNSPVIASQSS